MRDLEVFLESGYAVERVGSVDQFPFTGNIETVCLLSNRNTKPDTRVEFEVPCGKCMMAAEDCK